MRKVLSFLVLGVALLGASMANASQETKEQALAGGVVAVDVAVAAAQGATAVGLGVTLLPIGLTALVAEQVDPWHSLFPVVEYSYPPSW